MDKVQEARDRVVQAALSYQSSVMYHDAHPENPHGGDEIELKTELLDDAISEYKLATLQAGRKDNG